MFCVNADGESFKEETPFTNVNPSSSYVSFEAVMENIEMKIDNLKT